MLKKPLRISELLKGTSFELRDEQDEEQESDEEFVPDEEETKIHKNPCQTSFAELRTSMIEVSEGVFKKILTKPEDSKPLINLKRHRVIYHRLLYQEGEDFPFDSTYLNGKPDEICLAISSSCYLDGVLDALETMKEGEQSLFVISYKKMFKELGAPPRIKPKADVLCDFKVLRVEEVGDQEQINKIAQDSGYQSKHFAELKPSLEESRLRAKNLFSNRKINDAVKLYKKMRQIAKFAETANAEEEKERREILIQVNTNLAVCFNKRGEFRETMEHIKDLESLGGIENKPKALFAKGFALMNLGEDAGAAEALEKALKLQPAETKIINAIEELKKRKDSYDSFCKTFAENLKLKNSKNAKNFN